MIQIQKGNDLYEFIYEIVRQIPKGRVTTYGAIAACIGLKSGARVVGYAMNHSFRIQAGIPAHRVVNRNGLLTGKHHFVAPNTMEALLEQEGVRICNDKVTEFNRLFWNPCTELFGE